MYFGRIKGLSHYLYFHFILISFSLELENNLKSEERKFSWFCKRASYRQKNLTYFQLVKILSSPGDHLIVFLLHFLHYIISNRMVSFVCFVHPFNKQNMLQYDVRLYILVKITWSTRYEIIVKKRKLWNFSRSFFHYK